MYDENGWSQNKPIENGMSPSVAIVFGATLDGPCLSWRFPLFSLHWSVPPGPHCPVGPVHLGPHTPWPGPHPPWPGVPPTPGGLGGWRRGLALLALLTATLVADGARGVHHSLPLEGQAKYRLSRVKYYTTFDVSAIIKLNTIWQEYNVAMGHHI